MGLNEEELDVDQVVKDAKEQGIKEVTVNDDGSITYIMSKSKQIEIDGQCEPQSSSGIIVSTGWLKSAINRLQNKKVS